MKRRIVTGIDEQGRSQVVSQSKPPRASESIYLAGFSEALVWATEPGENINNKGIDLTGQTASFVPTPGGTRLITMTFPPEAVRESPEFDGAAFGAEFYAAMPGLAELFAPSGIHKTPTTDYVVVLEGELTLETDDGVLTTIGAGDIVVQNGTSHAWRNFTDQPTKVVVVMIGAEPTDKK